MLPSESLSHFASITSFYDAFILRTPYGKQAKQELQWLDDIDELTDIHLATDKILEWLQKSPSQLDKIQWHLKRLPLLPDFIDQTFSIVELFLFKKFLFNFNKIASLCDATFKEYFELYFLSQSLLNTLTIDNEGEVFHLNSSYSPQLSEIREEITKLDQQLEIIQKTTFERLEKDSLDFTYRDFLLINGEKASQLDPKLVSLEPFDQINVIARPIYPKNYFEISAKRSNILNQEKVLEEDILEKLSELIHEEKEHIIQYIQVITRLDLAIGRAKLATEFNLTKPHFRDDTLLTIEQGRFLPLEKLCLKKDEPYQTLDATFEHTSIVIYGSNMSGKTILLKTITALQMLAQMGFYVPAKTFETSLFSSIHYIGGIEENELNDGLSAFGKEMHQLNEASKNRGSNTLFIIDEFAHTTNSHEATALTVGLLRWIAQIKNIRVLLSTHNYNLPQTPQTTYYTMGGLNWEEFDKFTQKNKKNTDTTKDIITLIHRYMNYSLVPYSSFDIEGDAIKIARLLGAESNIIEYAFQYLKVSQSPETK